MKNEYEKARRDLDVLRGAAHVLRPCKIEKDAETPGEYQARRAREHRASILDARTEGRRCAVCGQTKHKSRSWVLLDARLRSLILVAARSAAPSILAARALRAGTLCRGCWQSLLHDRAPREAVLDVLVPDRRCPKCKRIYTLSKQWVVRRDGALCKGCDSRGHRA